MNAISPFTALERTTARQVRALRPDPAILAVTGSAAAAMMAAAALMVALGETEAAGPGLGGNVALLLFAVMNANRPYRRCWAPALIFLGLVGASGIALALLPAAEHFVTASAIARFSIEGLHGAAQLGAMGMTALAWSTAGRSIRGTRWSTAAFVMLANLQLGEAIARALAGSTGDAWTLASELLFASWLLATSMGLTRRLGGRLAGAPIRQEHLPPESVDVLREINWHGDRVR